jgi:hypothetical protein
MKRYPVFAVAALLFLLLFLLGSWVYVRNYGWPAGSAEGSAAKDVAVNAQRVPTADPFAEQHPVGSNGEDETRTRGGALETPTEPSRRGSAPEPVETRTSAAVSENTAPTEEVLAELVSGRAGVTDAKGDESGLDALIVSSLQAPESRWLDGRSSRGRTKEVAPTKLKAGDQTFELPPADQGAQIKGELIWPSLDKDTEDTLRIQARLQAVVFVEQMPESRVILDPESNRFSLWLTEKLEALYASRGLRLFVHSPSFELQGGYEAQLVRKEDGPIKLQLQPAPAIDVVVDVGPEDAVASGVRVWLERRGFGPDHDDNLYMSATVPTSGRLRFAVPEHYGEIRVAATGAQWHSGLPQVVELRDWKTTKVALRLNLAAEACDRVVGGVIADGDEASPLNAVRLECTHYGTTVYTGANGAFSMYVPYEGRSIPRQFRAEADGFRPEVIALERGGASSPGVTGDASIEPVVVQLAAVMTLEIKLPKEMSHWTHVKHLGEKMPTEIKSRSITGEQLKWGQRFIWFEDPNGANDPITLCIGEDDWRNVFRLYAAGNGSSASVSPQPYDDELRKR